MGRFVYLLASLGSAFLLGYSAATMAAVGWGLWTPRPDLFLSLGLWIFAGALALAAFGSPWPLPSAFPRWLDRSLGWGERLSTWKDLAGREDAAPVARLFLENLRRETLAADLSAVLARPRLRWQRAAFLGGILLVLLLLFPWRGGSILRTGKEGRPGPSGSSVEAGERGEPAAGGAGGDAEARAARPEDPKGGDRKDDVPPHPQPEDPERSYRVEARFVPAERREGPTALKDVFTYDLPVGTVARAAGEPTPFAPRYEELRRVAEEWIFREKLDAEESAFVRRYFERIRP